MNSESYNIIFAGTPPFAAVALEALIQSSHRIVAVYTQPDRPAGRGQKLTPSPVKALATEHKLPVYQPQKLHSIEKADVMVVVAYGLILPEAVLNTPRFGCLNIHASLLPRWRGAAPIQRAILEGDQETGITIMQMDKGLDTGPILYKMPCAITENDTSESLHLKLAKMGGEAILHVLDHLKLLKPQSQDNTLATYAHKITKDEAAIDWTDSAQTILRKIHGFNPWPVAFTRAEEKIVRIWDASVVKLSTHSPPGEIVSMGPEGILVATGQDGLLITQLQLPGARVLAAKDVINAKHAEFEIGKRLKR